MNTLLASWTGALFCVGVVSVSIFGYGLKLRHVLGRVFKRPLLDFSPLYVAVLGMGAFSTVSFAVGVAGGYNASLQTTVVLLGFIFAFWGRDFWKLSSSAFSGIKAFKNKQSLVSLWYLLPLAYFLARFFSAGLPQQHSDPLYYHLAAPKFWAEQGRILLTENHPSFAQASIWESVFGIPQLWIGTTGGFAHVTAQIFAQWMHFFWGQVLTVFLAAEILRKLAPQFESRAPIFFTAWLCCTLPSLEWVGCLAKSDYIITAFIFAGVLACMQLRFGLAGLFLGFAYSTKVLSAWAVIAMVPMIALLSGFATRAQLAKLMRAYGRFALAFALAIAPVIARNLLQTGNPVFPTLDDKLGPHWVSTLWTNHNASFGGAVRVDLVPTMFGWFWMKLYEHALPKILFCMGAAAFVFELARRKHSGVRAHRETLAWIAYLTIQTLLAFLMLRYQADGRYGSFFGILWLVFLLAAAFRMLAASTTGVKKAFLRYGWIAAAPLGLLINSPLDVIPKTVKNFWFEPATKYVELFHYEHPIHQWVHDNVDENEEILFAAEKINFYLDRPYDSVVEMRKWEVFFESVHSARELFAKVHARGYRYLHISPQTGGYPPWLKPYWDDLLSHRKEAVFETWNSLVFDLELDRY